MQTEHDMATLAGRLEYVQEACGYQTDADFALALGVKPQAVGNWKKRQTLGRDGPPALHRVTGVSTDWLRTGDGVAFPAGPKEAPKKPRLETMSDDLEEIRALLSAVVATIVVARPDVAPEMAEAVRDLAQGTAHPSRWIQGVAKLLADVPAPRRRSGRA